MGGKAEIIDLISFENNHKNTLNGGRIQHPGTFNANPLSAAAGTACLRTIANQPINERADQAAQRLCKGINEAFFDAKEIATPCSSLPQINATSLFVSLLYLAKISAGI